MHLIVIHILSAFQDFGQLETLCHGYFLLQIIAEYPINTNFVL